MKIQENYFYKLDNLKGENNLEKIWQNMIF
jgi:hypothetical protein